MKFQRRKDLSSDIRVWIAISAFMQQGVWGAITKLAREYKISRQLVYLMLWSLLEVFEPERNFADSDDNKPPQLSLQWDELVLAMRLAGCCSVGDLSDLLKILGIPNSSVGKISQFLNNVANNIPDELPEGEGRTIIVLGDEIFMAGKPILIMLDAKSHCILRVIVAEERNGQEWSSQYNHLLNKGYRIYYVVADRGEGLVKGCQLTCLTHHPDLMHLIRVFAPFLYRFERKAMQAIAFEDERKRVILSAISEEVLCKRNEQYTSACSQTEEAIRKYDDFAYLWQCLLRAFDLFNKDGTLRRREYVESELMAIMELMETEIGDLALVEVVRKFKNAVADYWGYFDRAQQIYQELCDIFPDDVLCEICLGWQKGKMSRGAKDYNRKKMLEKEAAQHLFLAGCADIDGIEEKIAAAIDRLEDNVRSSSPIEAINSQVRDFINSARGQITQNMLNLIAYFLNHKRATRGPYKETTPWERFTHTKENGNYLEQLLTLTAKKQ